MKENSISYKLRGLTNQRGGAIILAMGIASVGIIGLLASQIVSQNIFNNLKLQKTAEERKKISDSVEGLLNDQGFCNQFFSSGFATTAGEYDFQDSPSATVLTQMSKLNDEFSNYRPGVVVLENERALKPDSSGVQYKAFDISVSIEPKTAGLGIIAGSFGANSNKTNSNLKLVLSSNGRCFLDNFDTASNKDSGVYASCNALGGVYEDGRCFVKQYSVPIDGFMDSTKTVENQSTFADALCEMELSALRKLGPHMMNQSSSASKAFGWTSLCAKPRWAGCRASSNVDLLAEKGNDPNSTDLKLPGDTYSGQKVMKAKKFNKYMGEVSQATMLRRMNRVSGILTAESNIVDPNAALAKNKTNFYEVAGALGVTVSGFAAISPILTFLSAFSWAGPIGIAVAAVLTLLAPKCDKLRATVNFQCTEGFSEVASVDYETQKLKISLSGFKCKWRRGGTIDIPTDSELYALMKSNGYDLMQNVDIAADTASTDDLTEVLGQLNDPTLTLDKLVEMFNEEDAEAVEGTLDIPAELLAAILEKELSLWQKFTSEAEAQINSIMASPRAKEAAEADEAYQNFLIVHYESRKNELQSLASKTQSYVNFSKSLKNADGTTRDLTSTAVYSTYINPLIDKLNSASSKLKSNASSIGVNLDISSSLASIN